MGRTSVPTRVLDISPYNGFSLTCSATSRVVRNPTAITKAFSWTRSIDGARDGVPVVMDDNNYVVIMESGLVEAEATSVLMVNTSLSGSHVYTCSARLVVVPATDDIQEQDMETIMVQGKLLSPAEVKLSLMISIVILRTISTISTR